MYFETPLKRYAPSTCLDKNCQMVLVPVQQVFIFQTLHVQDGMLIDGLNLIFNWKEGVSYCFRRQKGECPTPLASRKYSHYLLYGCKIPVCQVTSGISVTFPGAVLQAVFYLFYILMNSTYLAYSECIRTQDLKSGTWT